MYEPKWEMVDLAEGPGRLRALVQRCTTPELAVSEPVFKEMTPIVGGNGGCRDFVHNVPGSSFCTNVDLCNGDKLPERF
jgi:hypothetical protein